MSISKSNCKKWYSNNNEKNRDQYTTIHQIFLIMNTIISTTMILKIKFNGISNYDFAVEESW